MSEKERRSSIEYNLRFLSGVAAALFAALLVGLVLVQHSLVSSQGTLETVVVPEQQELGELEAAVAAIFERQARVTSTTNSKQLDALRDRSAIHAQLEGAEAKLQARRGAAGDSASEARERGAAMAPAIQAFIDADNELFASVSRYHDLNEDFARRLNDAQAGLRGLTEQAAAIAGVVRLNNVVLLRHLAADPSPGLVHEVVFGGERAQLDCVQDLANAALALSALSGRIGLARTSDALNSIAANEVVQNRARIADRLEDLVALTEKDASLAKRADSLRSRFKELTSAIGDEKRSDSLLSIRRAIVVEQDHALEVREAGAQRARELTAQVTVLQGAANALTVASSVRAHRTATATLLGVVLLVGGGLATGVLGARRLRSSVSALRAQNQRLEQLSHELTTLNENLEGQVAERTKALAGRERALQLVLDSTGDGLLSVSLDGTVQVQRSRAATIWFGEGDAAKPDSIWSLLYADEDKAAMLRILFEQLAGNWLPFEVSAEQMPKQIERGGRALELAWKAVHEGDVLTRVLVIARDVTEQREAEKAERNAKEIHDLIGSMLRDKTAFAASVSEARELLQTISSVEDLDAMRRALHTLKGNMAMFGFLGVATSCHELESALAVSGGRPSESQVASLRGQLDATMQHMQDVVGTDFLSLVEVSPRDVDQLIQALETGHDRTAILDLVRSWRDEPVAPVLRRFAALADRLATQLGKEVDVVVEDSAARVPSGELRGLWATVVHAVRNAVDHGIEAPNERVAAGKPRHGQLVLRVSSEGHLLTIRVEDDGRGLDFEALRSAAQRKGLRVATQDDLKEAMFMDGVTTKSEVTAVSGRGVGMGALREICLALGGTLDVDSAVGAGTRLACRVPVSRVSMVTLVGRPSATKPSVPARRQSGGPERAAR